MFHLLILHCIKQIKGERSLSAIHHTLTGKKSSQTFQDMQAYDIAFAFGSYRSLHRDQLEQEVRALAQDDLIQIHNRNLHLTMKGEEYLAANWDQYPFSWLGGIHYHYMEQVYWSRLLLFVQTASHMVASQHNFIPVEEKQDILEWVKKKYKETMPDLRHYMQQLYEELHTILADMPEYLAELVVYRMSGLHRFGLSKAQLAAKFQCSIHDISVLLTAVIHYQLEHILHKAAPYPVLYSFCIDIQKQIPLTQSARKTREWLQKGQPLERIAQIRNLKQSTIQDHVIEIAIQDPGFSVEGFVPINAAHDISHKANELNTNRLKIIKEALDDQYSYFQIRLVLAAFQKETFT